MWSTTCLYLNHLLEETAKDRELELRFEVEATPKLLKQEGFDAVVTCTGAMPIKPPVDGVDLPHVVQAVDLLRDPSRAEKAQRVVVVGGGSVGCEVAYMLAYEMGKKEVAVIEMLPHFMKGVCTSNRGHLIHHLEKAGVKLFNCSRLKTVNERSVRVIRNMSRTVPDPYVTWSPLLAGERQESAGPEDQGRGEGSRDWKLTWWCWLWV